ncbi:MAG: VTT domain-containing protein [Anaerolineae bacterium]|nr:VTT domain-containing protein [Anaerolineae bacterium]
MSLLAFIAITIFVFSIRDRAAELAVYGYPGIFLVSLLAYATVFFPAPGLAIVFGMAGVFHPLGVALAAALGAGLGESTGYLAGISGRSVVENSQAYRRIQPFVEKYGAFAIIALTAIPNPIVDVASVAAGALKLPFWKFLLAAWTGQMIKMTAIAYAGSLSLGWLLNFP